MTEASPTELTALRQSRLAGIEGLRALAALSVLVHHAWLFSPATGRAPVELRGDRVLFNLRFGLTLFFVLSGFLLYRPFAAAVIANRRLPPIRGYLRSRALRILPAYWVVLIMTAFVLRTAVVSWPPIGIGALTDPHDLVASLLLVQSYDPDTIITGIGPAWSLCTEVVFYLLLPLLALGAARAARRWNSVGAALGPAAALLVLGIAMHVALANGLALHTRWETVIRLSFPANADYFAFGMIAAVLHVLARDRRASARPGLTGLAGGVALLGLLLGVALAPMDTARAGEHGWDTLVAAAFGVLVLICCLPLRATRPALGVLESRPLMSTGLVSYSVYLWHTPVVFLLHRWGVTSDDRASLLGCTAVALVATLALSAVSYRLVEKPMLARRHRRDLVTAAAAP